MRVLPLRLEKEGEREPDSGPEGGHETKTTASPELPELPDMLPVEGKGLDGAEVAVMTLLVLVEGEGLVLVPELPEEETESNSQVSAKFHTE